MADYRREFPTFGELDVELPPDFEDVSWKNEACPCFVYERSEVILYVDFKDPADREHTSMRRFIAFAMLDGNVADELLIETDDIADVAKIVESRRK